MKWAMRESMKGQEWVSYWNCRENETEQEFGLTREHATPGRIKDRDKDGMFAFCFVRHPVAWYKSYWGSWNNNGRRVGFPLDNVWDDNYEQFIISALDNYPGFVSRMFRMYEPMDYVGKQESLVDDLVTALTLAGEEFDEGVLRRIPGRNESSGKAVLSKELEDRIIQSEQWAIREFYA